MARKRRNHWGWAQLAAAVVAIWAASPGLAQDLVFGGNRWKYCPPQVPQAPECARPETPVPPTVPAPPEAVRPSVPLAPTVPPEQFAALGGETVALADRSAVGYIDPAIPMTQFRLRCRLPGQPAGPSGVLLSQVRLLQNRRPGSTCARSSPSGNPRRFSRPLLLP